MDIIKKFERFLKKARLKHGNKFDYSQGVYVSARLPLKIICPHHKDFYQCPANHFGKYGCPKCAIESKKGPKKPTGPHPQKRISKEEYLEKCINKYGNKFQYDLTEYVELTQNHPIIVICPNHGPTQQKPENHLGTGVKTGCPECGKEQKRKKKTNSYDSILKRINHIHKNKYKYPEENRQNYLNQSSQIKITCPTHETFIQRAQKHINGRGCHKCKIEELIEQKILAGTYTTKFFNRNPSFKVLPAILYYLKINDGEFYKIGITRTTVANRIKSLKSLSKGIIHKVELLKTKTDTLYKCFQDEQSILSLNKNLRIYENWSTELFTKDITNSISNFF